MITQAFYDKKNQTFYCLVLNRLVELSCTKFGMSKDIYLDLEHGFVDLPQDSSFNQQFFNWKKNGMDVHQDMLFFTVDLEEKTNLSETWSSKKKQEVFQTILKNAVISFEKLKEIRQRYPPELTQPQQEELRKEIFEIKESTTAFETCMRGEFLDQLLEINRWVYTTSSTNHPHEINNPYGNPNFFLCFYVLENLGELIFQEFLKLDENEYDFIMMDMALKCKYRVSPQSKLENLTTELLKNKQSAHEFDIRHLEKLYSGENKLVLITIDDNKQDRKDLYKVVLNILILIKE
jgi:hypothetical protein